MSNMFESLWLDHNLVLSRESAVRHVNRACQFMGAARVPVRGRRARPEPSNFLSEVFYLTKGTNVKKKTPTVSIAGT
jgi:hypothetical protein